MSSSKWLNRVKWDDQGLVPVIAQQFDTKEVLMFAWMNREALARTVETGEAVYWSRSRKKLWHKGEESGHTQKVVELRLDCDEDVILMKIDQRQGIACHTGRRSCFYQKLQTQETQVDWQTIDPIVKEPELIYK